MKKRIVSLPMVLALCLTLLPTSAFAAEGSGAAIGTSGLCAHHTVHDDTCGYVEEITESPCTHEHGAECYTEVTSCIHEHTEACYPAVDNGTSGGATDPDAQSGKDASPSDTEPSEDTTSPDTESGENVTSFVAELGEPVALFEAEPGEDALPTETAEPTECSHVCSVESGCIKQELDCPHKHDEACGYVPAVEGHPCTYVCTLCGLTEITAWSWVDELEAINPENGVLALSASEDSPALYDDIVALLPTEITATTQDDEETIALGGWTCPDYPEAGACTGRYKFTAALPDGYALAKDAPALTVTVEFGGVAMLADTTHAAHPICGASCSHESRHDVMTSMKRLSVQDSQLGADGTIVKEFDGCYDLPAGSYYLSENITLDIPILVLGNEVNLCLNGYTITMNGNNPVFRISNNSYGSVGTLNLTDCSGNKTGTITHAANTTGYGVWLMKGNFNMYGGTITGNDCGVFIFYSDKKASQEFIMYGGSITGNHSAGGAGGAGVRFCHGSMKLNGSPIITDNTAMGNTSNLWLDSDQTVTIDGGLTADADIGVSTAQTPTSSSPVSITNECGTNYSSYFHSDNANYEIGISRSVYNGNFTVQLTTKTGSETHTHNWVYSNPPLRSDTILATCTNEDTKCDTPTATVTIEAPQNTIYDGMGKAATLKLENWEKVSTDDITIKYDRSTDSGYEEVSGTPTEVGDYMAYIIVGEGKNTKTALVPFEITDGSTPTPGEKADPVYTAPTAKTDLTYNGQAQALITPGSATGGTMQYKLDDGTYSTTIPTATDAGTYTVYYKIIGDATHNDVAETTIDVIIRQATPTGTPTFTPITEAGKTIADVTLTAPAGWPAGTFSWLYGETGLPSTTPVTQGTSYHWIFIPDDTSNYTSTGGYLVLWPNTSGGNSGDNSGGGNNSNTPDNDNGSSNTGNSDNGSSDTGNSDNGSSDTWNSDNGNSDTGNSDNNSSNTNTPSTPVTVPVSGDEKTIHVDTAVSGATATIKNVDLSKLDTVIGDNVKTGVVTIDFSALKKVDTVKLPSNVVKQIAEAVNDPNNDAKSLAIALTNGTAIEFNAKVLGEKTVQANGADIIISIKRIADSSLNSKQKLAVGNRPALNINVTIGGKPISDMSGKVTVSASYELKPGEHASGIVVYYIDANGNRKLCETSYDPISKRVSWKTSQLSPSSVYMIGYDESRVKPGTGSYVTYTVQKGNTLSMIAKKHGCTVAEIMAANSGLIKNPNRIYVGWQFKIPQH